MSEKGIMQRKKTNEELNASGLVNINELARCRHLSRRQATTLFYKVVEQDGYSIIDTKRIRLCVADDVLKKKR